jgi:hypothetical protein
MATRLQYKLQEEFIILPNMNVLNYCLTRVAALANITRRRFDYVCHRFDQFIATLTVAGLSCRRFVLSPVCLETNVRWIDSTLYNNALVQNTSRP